MSTLIVGASGATGRLLVEQLLTDGHAVKVVVRSMDSLPETVKDHPDLTIIQASLLDLSDADMARLVRGCNAVVSCLGHNMTFKGLFGAPRKLVTDATRRLCKAIRANAPSDPVKFVLMNTTGNSNRDLHERTSLGQKIVTGILRVLLPPHVDNEQAADYLRLHVGQNDPMIEWAAVRPDNLIDAVEITNFDIHASPVRDPIFDSGQTSRINVAAFMHQLTQDEDIWQTWKGQMPVIYNHAASMS